MSKMETLKIDQEGLEDLDKSTITLFESRFLRKTARTKQTSSSGEGYPNMIQLCLKKR
jgi:hypothetical protein